MSLLRPLVVCGPSGAGKSTLLKAAMKTYPNAFQFSVSCTTRSPRTGELNGKDYYFVTESDFKRKLSAGDFMEWAQVHAYFYGTELAEITRSKGRVCILDIDIQGVHQVKGLPDLNPLCIFIKPPSLEVLEERLRGRNTDSSESIELRLKNARKEMEFVEKNLGFFDSVILNDELEAAKRSLLKCLVAAYPWLGYS